jgi:hypothetical protein
MDPNTGRTGYFQNYKKGDLPTEKSERPTDDIINREKYNEKKREFI